MNLLELAKSILFGKQKKEAILSPIPSSTPIPTTTPTPNYIQAIKDYMNSQGAPVATLAAQMVNEGQKYPITQKYPYLPAAVSINETSGGKNQTYPNNPVNWGIKEPTFQPTSPEQTFERMISGIGKRSPYYEDFRKSGDLKEFASHYAPPGENNTVQYVLNLIKIMNDIKSFEKKKK